MTLENDVIFACHIITKPPEMALRVVLCLLK